MKAMVLHAPNTPFVLEERPDPVAGPGEAVAKVFACGAGLTIEHVRAGRAPATFPRIIGHEISAEIVEVGQGVTELTVGDPVTCYFYSPCGHCRWCNENRETICINQGPRVGYQIDGGYAEYIKLPVRNFLKLPEGLDYKGKAAEVAVIADALATPFKVVRYANVRPLENVAVVGAGGGLGIHMIKVAKWQGAHVIAVERRPEKFATCRAVGADAVVDASGNDAVAALMDATGGRGADVVIDFVSSQTSLETGFACARAGWPAGQPGRLGAGVQGRGARPAQQGSSSARQPLCHAAGSARHAGARCPRRFLAAGYGSLSLRRGRQGACTRGPRGGHRPCRTDDRRLTAWPKSATTSSRFWRRACLRISATRGSPTRCYPARRTRTSMARLINFVVEQLLPRDHKSVFWGDRLLTIDKSAGFLEEPRFAAALAQIRGSHLYDQYRSPQTIAWRLHTLVWAAKHALALPAGEFVECGTFKGDMAFVITETTDIGRSGRAFHLYDFFSGLHPELSSDADFPDLPGYIATANAHYRQPGLYESVVSRFAAKPYVHVHKGFLPEALGAEVPRQIGFLHIDLNSPKAEIGRLERLFARVVPSGLIILDDYGWKSYRAQKQAEDAFFAARGHSVLELPTGQGLVVKQAQAAGAGHMLSDWLSSARRWWTTPRSRHRQ